MEKEISKEEFIKLSDEDLKCLAKNYALEIYLYNGSWKQIGKLDSLRFDESRSVYISNSGVKIYKREIKSIKLVSTVDEQKISRFSVI